MSISFNDFQFIVFKQTGAYSYLCKIVRVPSIYYYGEERMATRGEGRLLHACVKVQMYLQYMFTVTTVLCNSIKVFSIWK